MNSSDSNDSMASPLSPLSPQRQRCIGRYAARDHEELILNILQRLGAKSYSVMKKFTTQKELANIEWEVDKLMDIVIEDGEWYLLKWKDWPASFASWERSDMYKLDPSLFEEFRTRQINVAETASNGESSVATEENNSAAAATKIKRNITNEELADMARSLNKHLSWATFMKIMLRLDKEMKLEIFRENEPLLNHNIVQRHISIPCGLSKIHSSISSKLINRKRLEWKLSQLEKVHVQVVNDVDDESIPMLPEGFEYLVTNRYNAPDISPDALESVVGCTCRSCGPSTRKCCSQQAGVHFAYRDDVPNTLIDFRRSQAIYECTTKCKCTPETCSNRVMQKGLTIPMQLFKTVGRGWGLRALRPIKQGEFVIEYVGEVITSAQADDRKGNQYLFDLDYNPEGESNYTIDAMTYGNLSRFINSRCEDANLSSLAVYVECVHPDLPRIGFFANRDIEQMEELTFDYMLQGGMTGVEQCLCGSQKCRGTINKQQSAEGTEKVSPQKPVKPVRESKKAKKSASAPQVNNFVSPLRPGAEFASPVTFGGHFGADVSDSLTYDSAGHLNSDFVLSHARETIDLVSPEIAAASNAMDCSTVAHGMNFDDEDNFSDDAEEVWHNARTADYEVASLHSLHDSEADAETPMKPHDPPPTPPSEQLQSSSSSNPTLLAEQNPIRSPGGDDADAIDAIDAIISSEHIGVAAVLVDDEALSVPNKSVLTTTAGIDLLSENESILSSTDRDDVVLEIDVDAVHMNGVNFPEQSPAIDGEQAAVNN